MFSLFVLQDSIYYLAGDQNVVNVQAMYLNRSSFSDSVWKPVYRPLEPGKDVSAMSGSSIWKAFPWALCLLLFGYILLRRNGRRKPPAISQAADPGSDPDTLPLNREQRVAAFMAALSETEREFLRELMRLSLQDQRMDIPLMNKLLGVANKDIEIQKSRRSITINNINDLYTKICREPGLVVKKERSEFDKRSFLYYCDTATINILVNHFD